MAHKYLIEDLQKFATDKGGQCLSENTLIAVLKLWSTTYDIVHSGSWCPICNNGGRNGTKS